MILDLLRQISMNCEITINSPDLDNYMMDTYSSSKRYVSSDGLWVIELRYKGRWSTFESSYHGDNLEEVIKRAYNAYQKYEELDKMQMT